MKKPPFEREFHNRGRGRAAEEDAARFLRSESHRIFARDVITKPGEINILAQEADDLGFVEVKARTRKDYGGPLAAALYLANTNTIGRAVRFDVLGMERVDGKWCFSLIRNAFQATSLYLA